MKTIVKVRCDFELDGRITPLLFRTQEGPAVRIDRVLDVRPAASTRSGGRGMRYLCRVGGQQLYLLHDEGEKEWFVDFLP